MRLGVPRNAALAISFVDFVELRALDEERAPSRAGWLPGSHSRVW
jgi:hypothetical protein